ncbi:MAG: hypothetical protein WCJ36_01755 [Candidatus Saccharibacteria bacterium]
MSSAAEILVVILSIALTFFLILGMVLVVYLIVLTRQIRKITKSAERTVDGLESTVAGFSKMISPIFVAEMVNKFIKKFKTNQKEK